MHFFSVSSWEVRRYRIGLYFYVATPIRAESHYVFSQFTIIPTSMDSRVSLISFVALELVTHDGQPWNKGMLTQGAGTLSAEHACFPHCLPASNITPSSLKGEIPNTSHSLWMHLYSMFSRKLPADLPPCSSQEQSFLKEWRNAVLCNNKAGSWEKSY